MATTAIANREATVVTVTGGTLPYWAPIYSTTTDGSVIGKTSISFGDGAPGAAITTSPPRGTTGTLRGWQWGTDTGVQTWGTNVINNVFTDTSTPANNEYLQTTFDQNGLPDESTLSGGDSGGGTFVKGPDGVWKLAGVNSSVSPAAYALTQFPANPKSPLLGSAFDFSDLYLESNQTDGSGNPLYYQAQQFFPGQSPIPQTASFSNISDIGAAALAAFVPHAGDVNADGKVNALDFNAIAAHFGMSSGAIWTQGDLNYDGNVNALDFTILASNFGYSGPVPGQILGADALGFGSSRADEPCAAGAGRARASPPALLVVIQLCNPRLRIHKIWIGLYRFLVFRTSSFLLALLLKDRRDVVVRLSGLENRAELRLGLIDSALSGQQEPVIHPAGLVRNIAIDSRLVRMLRCLDIAGQFLAEAKVAVANG